jgi:hypothetical protein
MRNFFHAQLWRMSLRENLAVEDDIWLVGISQALAQLLLSLPYG